MPHSGPDANATSVATIRRLMQRPEFRSAKTISPLPFDRRWHRDALIQLTLSPDVTGLFAESAPDRESSTALFARTKSGTVEVLLSEEPIDPTAKPVGLWITREQTYREPTCSNARAVWQFRHAPVTVGDRIRILSALADERVPLRDLGAAVTSSHDPFGSIARLFCDGQIHFDLTDQLDPRTLVYSTRSADFQNESKSTLRCNSSDMQPFSSPPVI